MLVQDRSRLRTCFASIERPIFAEGLVVGEVQRQYPERVVGRVLEPEPVVGLNQHSECILGCRERGKVSTTYLARLLAAT